MKFKTVLVFTMLVFASLISFSNRHKSHCDGRKMFVHCMSNAEQEATSYEGEMEAAGASALLRIAVTL